MSCQPERTTPGSACDNTSFLNRIQPLSANGRIFPTRGAIRKTRDRSASRSFRGGIPFCRPGETRLPKQYRRSQQYAMYLKKMNASAKNIPRVIPNNVQAVNKPPWHPIARRPGVFFGPGAGRHRRLHGTPQLPAPTHRGRPGLQSPTLGNIKRSTSEICFSSSVFSTGVRQPRHSRRPTANRAIPLLQPLSRRHDGRANPELRAGHGRQNVLYILVIESGELCLYQERILLSISERKQAAWLMLFQRAQRPSPPIARVGHPAK